MLFSLVDCRPVANYVTSTVETVLALHREERNGDVLAFLTGQEEVETVVAQLRWVWSWVGVAVVNSSPCIHREHAGQSSKGMQLSPVPLYGGLPYGEQVSSLTASHHTTHTVCDGGLLPVH